MTDSVIGPPNRMKSPAAKAHASERPFALRNLEGWLFICKSEAAIPPGYRVQFGGPVEEDRPRLPDGTSPKLRVDNNGSLAVLTSRLCQGSDSRDLAQAYPTSMRCASTGPNLRRPSTPCSPTSRPTRACDG